MTGIFLDSIIAIILAGLVAFLLWRGRQNFANPARGWIWIIAGFSLLLFAELIRIAPHFDPLDRFTATTNTFIVTILEKAVGTLGGFLALAVGLVLLIPGVRDILEESSMRKGAEEARFRSLPAPASPQEARRWPDCRRR